jgi:hypothetical protein
MRPRMNVVIIGLALATTTVTTAQQLQFLSGQNVAPYFEGWEQNPDGSFSMVFGYLNRNYREELNIPLGPNNVIEPAGLPQPQPTYFYPRRHRYLFRVRVPKDWGKKDVIWTLTSNGKTEKAYGNLVPEQAVDEDVIVHNRGGSPGPAPSIQLEGDAQRTAAVDQPLSLTVKVSSNAPSNGRGRGTAPAAAGARGAARGPGFPADGDDAANAVRGRGLSISDQPGVGVDVDGSGKRLLAVGRYARTQSRGLRVAWLEWRGPGTIIFDPWFLEGVDDRMPGFVPPPIPADGRVTTTARFSAAGTYVIRALADTGGLFTPLDITVNVSAASSPTSPNGSTQRPR